MTGADEKAINEELKALEKVGTSREVTTRLKKVISSVDGQSDTGTINAYVNNMLARDSLFLRERLTDIAPDIEKEEVCELIHYHDEAVKIYHIWKFVFF